MKPHGHETVYVENGWNIHWFLRFGSVANEPHDRSYSLDSFDCMTTSSLAMYQNPVSQFMWRRREKTVGELSYLTLSSVLTGRFAHVLVCIVFPNTVTLVVCHCVSFFVDLWCHVDLCILLYICVTCVCVPVFVFVCVCYMFNLCKRFHGTQSTKEGHLMLPMAVFVDIFQHMSS